MAARRCTASTFASRKGPTVPRRRSFSRRSWSPSRRTSDSPLLARKRNVCGPPAVGPTWHGAGAAIEQGSNVARAVLRLVKDAGRKVERGVQIDFPIRRQDIAGMTGTTLHTVSRILSAWEEQGIVEGGRQRIVLRDSQKLALLAEGDAE